MVLWLMWLKLVNSLELLLVAPSIGRTTLTWSAKKSAELLALWSVLEINCRRIYCGHYIYTKEIRGTRCFSSVQQHHILNTTSSPMCYVCRTLLQVSVLARKICLEKMEEALLRSRSSKSVLMCGKVAHAESSNSSASFFYFYLSIDLLFVFLEVCCVFHMGHDAWDDWLIDY